LGDGALDGRAIVTNFGVLVSNLVIDASDRLRKCDSLGPDDHAIQIPAMFGVHSIPGIDIFPDVGAIEESEIGWRPGPSSVAECEDLSPCVQKPDFGGVGTAESGAPDDDRRFIFGERAEDIAERGLSPRVLGEDQGIAPEGDITDRTAVLESADVLDGDDSLKHGFALLWETQCNDNSRHV